MHFVYLLPFVLCYLSQIDNTKSCDSIILALLVRQRIHTQTRQAMTHKQPVTTSAEQICSCLLLACHIRCSILHKPTALKHTQEIFPLMYYQWFVISMHFIIIHTVICFFFVLFSSKN